MSETAGILLFHMNIFKAEQIRRLAGSAGISAELVPADKESLPLRTIAGVNRAGGKGRRAAAPAPQILTQEMLVMYGLEDKQLDDFLGMLRREGLKVDLKAVLTPINVEWTAQQLFAELSKEHAFYLGR